jgi:transcriptional regulator with XRE-family HTH domain
VSATARREVPAKIRDLKLGERVRWARRSAGLSHDRLVEVIGRSNRGHLIKIERGDHIPRQDLRDAIADATNVPRELFADDDEEESRAVTLDEFLRFRVRELIREDREGSVA